MRSAVSLPLIDAGDELAVVALERGDLADLQVHVTGRDQSAHLVDAVGRAAEVVAPVHERQALGKRLEIERPVERTVATADDQQVLAAESVHLAHGVVHRLVFVGLDAVDRRPLRLERAATRGDHHAFALEGLVAVADDAELRLAQLLDLQHHLAEMEGRMKRLDLLHQSLGEPVAGDHRDAGNVVDRLLRIEFGALAADLVEDVDQVRLDVEQAELEHREQPDRPRADDDNVGLDRLAHALPGGSPAPVREFRWWLTPNGARCD